MLDLAGGLAASAGRGLANQVDTLCNCKVISLSISILSHSRNRLMAGRSVMAPCPYGTRIVLF